MAELEIHHEEHGEHDPLGQRVGILASLLAVALAIVTIASHRAHTEGVLTKADENDKWSFYQSKKIKLHSLELGVDIAALVGAKGEDADKRVERFKKDIERYDKESEDVRKEATALEKKVETAEDRALRYDFGEGLIEIGLVLSSLYFIAKRHIFPIVGVIAGVAGILIATSGLLVQ
jgi:hypothetical protein